MYYYFFKVSDLVSVILSSSFFYNFSIDRLFWRKKLFWEKLDFNLHEKNPLSLSWLTRYCIGRKVYRINIYPDAVLARVSLKKIIDFSIIKIAPCEPIVLDYYSKKDSYLSLSINDNWESVYSLYHGLYTIEYIINRNILYILLYRLYYNGLC